MASVSTPRQVALADRCYRLLLLTYPADFRSAYAAEMASTFRACCREALREEGSWGLVRLSGSTICDLITTSIKEHLQTLLSRLKHLFGNQVPLVSPAGLDAMLLTAPLRLQVAQHTDIGCKRIANEDNLITVLPEDPQILQDKGALFVVADGMGGHAQGDRASELAVNTVREIYYQTENEERAASLTHAIKQANALIYQENGACSPQTGMGTTCIAAVLQEKTLTVANVGDSRIYVIHEGQIRQISRDHSWVAEQVQAGLLTEEQARTHTQRNIITRALGTQAEVEIDVFEETVAEGDALILCTDGLCGLVKDEEMLQIVETYQPEESVQQLIARANAAGGPDNITAIVVRVAA
jgi:PPM family protein phosphatase